MAKRKNPAEKKNPEFMGHGYEELLDFFEIPWDEEGGIDAPLVALVAWFETMRLLVAGFDDEAETSTDYEYGVVCLFLRSLIAEEGNLCESNYAFVYEGMLHDKMDRHSFWRTCMLMAETMWT